MQKLIEEFEAVCADRALELIAAKAQGKVIVEYTGTFVPEEIIEAAGAEGYPMWQGGQPEPVDAVLEESIRVLTPLVRTPYGLAHMGLDPVADICDIYAHSLTDVQSSRISELFESAGYPVCKVAMPFEWLSDYDRDYYKERLRRFMARLEEKTGKAITDEDLLAAIEKYNTIRGLLRQLNDLRKAEKPVISGSEFIRVNHCAAIASPDTAIDHLTRILAAAKAAPAPEKALPRVILFGKAVAVGDYFVVRALEEAGCNVVFEIVDECELGYLNDVSTEGDPLDAIVQNRYRDRLPHTCMQPSWDVRQRALLDAIDEYNAQGVLLYDQLYDEIADMEFGCISDLLGEKGIPAVRIQTSYEYTREAMGPLRTRVETFASTLQGGVR